MKTPYQAALPSDVVPDCGPKHRGGGALFLLCLLATVPALLFAIGSAHARNPGPLIFFALFFGLLAVWGWWCLIESGGKKPGLPRCRYLLEDDLDFVIPRKWGDVAYTAFFRPDGIAPGEASCLLVFLENYASRQRRIHIHLPRCHALGMPKRRTLRLLLLPGQAAAYRLPLRQSGDIRQREIGLKIRLSIKWGSRRGCLLPSVSGRKHRNETFAVTSRLYLYPTLAIAPSASAIPTVQPLADEAYLSLSTPGLAQPRFELLRQISENPPDRAVALDETPPSLPPKIPSPSPAAGAG